MVDLYIANVALYNLSESDADSLQALYREQIETIHDVDMTIMEADIEKLQGHLPKYQELHRAVEDTIAIRLKEKDAKAGEVKN